MKFIWRLLRRDSYRSVQWFDSRTHPGVQYAIRSVSLQSRMELVQKTREVSMKHEFLKAGNVPDQLEASLSDLLVGQIYLEWGLVAVRGLHIDGRAADASTLIRYGPETLSNEIIEAIKSHLCLTENERKNS
jgi:hypothetical protein